MANISIGGRISLLQRVASLDLRYGPYSSIADAYENMGPSGDEVITAGLPFGVTEDDGSVSVYIWTKGENATQNDCKKLDKEHIVLFNGFIDISVSIKQQSYNNIATKDNIVFISDRKQFAYRDGLNFYINWKNRYVWSNENLIPYDDVIYIDINDNKAYYYNGTTLTLLASETFVSSVNNQAPDASGNVNITKEHIGLNKVDNTADTEKVVKGASEDGSGNNIINTYETKNDATTKQTALQGAINALQTSVAALTGLDSTNFGGFSIQSTEADAISNIATLYTADGYTDELLWYMAGTSLSSVKAYRYNGSGTPTAISSDTYNCVDFSGLITDVSTLRQDINALGPEITHINETLKGKSNTITIGRRFMGGGYANVANYACSNVIEGDGSTYTFTYNLNWGIGYKIFQYVSDTEGVELSGGSWLYAQTQMSLNVPFVVTFYGNSANWNKLQDEYYIDGADTGFNGRLRKLEGTQSNIVEGATIERINSEYVKQTVTKNGTDTNLFLNIPQCVGKNLLNKNAEDVQLGYRQYTATPSASSSYNLSGYIAVEAGKRYVFSCKDDTHKDIVYLVVFDKNRNFLRLDATRPFLAQEGDCYIRITVRIESWAKSPQLEEGSTPTEYEDYGVEFKYQRIVSPSICMPSVVYVLSGIENSIYHKNFLNYTDERFIISSYRNNSSAKWKFLSRCFRTTTGGQDLVILKTDVVTRKEMQKLIVAVETGSPSTNNGSINVLCIGDSFTYDGRYVKMIADSCPNVTMVGMRTPAQVTGVECEGRGGWTLGNYASNAYGDLTSSHMQPFSPFIQANGYNYYGPTPFWAAIVNGTSQYAYGTNGFSKYASWFGTDGKKLNPSANDLMFDGTNYIYWNGSSWVTLSNAPTFAFDFTKYISIWQIASPDIVTIFLGKNDFHTGVSGWSSFKTDLDALIESIHTYDSSIIIGICTPTTADEAPNNSDNVNAALAHFNMWDARKLIIDNYDNDTMKAANTFVVDTGTTLDPDYGFVNSEQLPFAFYSGDEREIVSTNGVHPSGDGYKQIGVCIAGFIQAKR